MKQLTDNQIDLIYLLGIFNSVGIDGLGKEIERLNKIGVRPHEIIDTFINPQNAIKPNLTSKD